MLLTLSPPCVTPIQNKKLDHLCCAFGLSHSCCCPLFRTRRLFCTLCTKACQGLLCLILGFLLRPYARTGGHTTGWRCWPFNHTQPTHQWASFLIPCSFCTRGYIWCLIKDSAQIRTPQLYCEALDEGQPWDNIGIWGESQVEWNPSRPEPPAGLTGVADK